MPFIPTKIHGVLDYLVSLFVVALPFLFGVEGGTKTLFVALGVVGIAYSLLTAYELGAVKLIPMRTHLLLDAVFVVGLLALAVVVPPAPLRIVCGVLAVAVALVVYFTRRATSP